MLGIELETFFAPFPLSRFSFARYARCRTPERFIGRAFIARILLARLRRVRLGEKTRHFLGQIVSMSNGCVYLGCVCRGIRIVKAQFLFLGSPVHEW